VKSPPGIALILALACAGCVSSQHLAQDQAPAPVFDPATFFVGHTEGKATLNIALHHPRPVVVEGHGRIDADGTLILDQSVQTGTGPAKPRSWRFHPDGPGRWSGTLSDAAGPVRGDITGNCLHLAFAMKGGLKAQQWLYLQRGGTIVRNVMVVRKLGLPVARLNETITRKPD
jgi:hypothetical protein